VGFLAHPLIILSPIILHIMKKFFLNLIRFWNEDRSLTVMFLLLLLFIFILVPSVNPGRFGEVFIKIVYSVMLITGIFSVAKNKRFVTVVSIFAILSLFANWISDIEPTRTMLVANDLGSIFFDSFFAWAILVKTFRQGEITYQRIEGSIVAYLLLGLIFASVFHAVYLFAGPTSFNNIKGDNIKEFLYFSFTSLTTMGYGDITPVHPLARSLANFEALIGQLYPAILIARLVSMEFESSSKKKKRIE
jgi:hypothetical protein